jgi:hypothetical protein
VRELYTEITIAAPADVVWTVLLDFDEYESWNPFVRSISGSAAEGERLMVHIEPEGRRPMQFRPIVTCNIARREFRWLGRFLLPRLFDGEHSFELHEIQGRQGAGVRFVQKELFSGLLVPLFWRSMAPATESGFRAMNRALKTRAEVTWAQRS